MSHLKGGEGASDYVSDVLSLAMHNLVWNRQQYSISIGLALITL